MRNTWRPIGRDCHDQGKHFQRIGTERLGPVQELNDVDAAPAAFDARDPSLLLTQRARERLLPDTASLARINQQLDQPFVAFGSDRFHSDGKYSITAYYTKSV